MESTQSQSQPISPQAGPVGIANPLKQFPIKKFPKMTWKSSAPLIVASIFVVLAGVGTGWLLSGKVSGGSLFGGGEKVAPGAKMEASEAGLADEATFRDSAEGVLKEGGVDGEGTHHLEREGGPSQNVYLTSTVIDLASFVGKKVMVWGETISAKEAGWLMDVGKVKVVE